MEQETNSPRPEQKSPASRSALELQLREALDGLMVNAVGSIDFGSLKNKIMHMITEAVTTMVERYGHDNRDFRAAVCGLVSDIKKGNDGDGLQVELTDLENFDEYVMEKFTRVCDDREPQKHRGARALMELICHQQFMAKFLDYHASFENIVKKYKKGTFEYLFQRHLAFFAQVLACLGVLYFHESTDISSEHRIQRIVSALEEFVDVLIYFCAIWGERILNICIQNSYINNLRERYARLNGDNTIILMGYDAEERYASSPEAEIQDPARQPIATEADKQCYNTITKGLNIPLYTGPSFILLDGESGDIYWVSKIDHTFGEVDLARELLHLRESSEVEFLDFRIRNEVNFVQIDEIQIVEGVYCLVSVPKKIAQAMCSVDFLVQQIQLRRNLHYAALSYNTDHQYLVGQNGFFGDEDYVPRFHGIVPGKNFAEKVERIVHDSVQGQNIAYPHKVIAEICQRMFDQLDIRLDINFATVLCYLYNIKDLNRTRKFLYHMIYCFVKENTPPKDFVSGTDLYNQKETRQLKTGLNTTEVEKKKTQPWVAPSAPRLAADAGVRKGYTSLGDRIRIYGGLGRRFYK